jgi:hypothetical protein
MTTCALCQVNELDETDLSTGICSKCRSATGIVPMPPATRRALPCRGCNGLVFIRVIPREFSATGGDYVHEQVAPMAATHAPSVTPKLLFKGSTVSTPNIEHGYGRLELYICKACGEVAWHCPDPAAIPIGPAYMTELVDHTQTGPYR